ncbi:MAG: DUF4178 domain-containing protein [Fluviicola sp.]|nr:DUF4178 domain-containing protein [Fluviicola sp.]
MSDFYSYLQHSGNQTHFNCPKCKTKTLLHHYQQVELFACTCETIYWTKEFHRYQHLNNHFGYRGQKLKIGSQGEFEGKTYTVIGVAHKKELGNQFAKWTEFVLIDQNKNISFLNCSYGNYTWMYISDRIKAVDFITNIDDYIEFDGIEYELFSSYKQSTEAIRGEFHYNPVNIKKIECFDFISPPKVISIEKTESNTYDCFEGFHITRERVAEIFKTPAIAYQEHEGIGMAQPYFIHLKTSQINRIALFFALLMILMSVFWTASFYEKKLIYTQIPVDKDQPKEIITTPFYLNESFSPYYLRFDGNSYLSNEWIEAGITLVNEKNGEEKELGFVLEYYSGVDNGYSWSEGSNSATAYLSGVAPGKYHLKIKPYCSLITSKNMAFSAHIASPVWWNTGMMILCIFVIVIILNILDRQVRRLRSGEIDNLFGSSYNED